MLIVSIRRVQWNDRLIKGIIMVIKSVNTIDFLIIVYIGKFYIYTKIRLDVLGM